MTQNHTETTSLKEIFNEWGLYVINAQSIFTALAEKIDCTSQADVSKEIEDFILSTNPEMHRGIFRLLSNQKESFIKHAETQNISLTNENLYANYFGFLANLIEVQRKRCMSLVNEAYSKSQLVKITPLLNKELLTTKFLIKANGALKHHYATHI